jgi:glycerate 2-kinase
MKEAGEDTGIIRNAAALTSHGNIDGRKILLEIMNAGLKAADPYPNTRKLLRMEGGKLIVGIDDFEASEKKPAVFDLSKIRNIFIIGGGKAVQRMAKAVEDVLGDRITEGHINAKEGDEKQLKKVEISFGGHPLPDEKCAEGAKRILEIAKKVKKGDLVFYLSSGGATSLMALPPPGISLEDLRKVYLLLYFDRGIPIWELNVVRHHLSTAAGHKISGLISEAQRINLTTMELWPEETTEYMNLPYELANFKEAVRILKKYDVWDDLPPSVRKFFEDADPKYEVPKTKNRSKTESLSFNVIDCECMLQASAKKANELGLNPVILAQRISAEAKDAARTLASVAREVEMRKRPFKPPCVLISGGELIVTMGKADLKTKGGRNQEFALASATRIEGSKRITVASVDSDGTDGPTEVAGGMADGYTMNRAKELNVDVFRALYEHNSYEALIRLEDTIFTGSTGTNIQDLRLFYISN